MLDIAEGRWRMRIRKPSKYAGFLIIVADILCSRFHVRLGGADPGPDGGLIGAAVLHGVGNEGGLGCHDRFLRLSSHTRCVASWDRIACTPNRMRSRLRSTASRAARCCTERSGGSERP